MPPRSVGDIHQRPDPLLFWAREVASATTDCENSPFQQCGGFAGSLAAMLLVRCGHDVTLALRTMAL